jgi:hypothetical protein
MDDSSESATASTAVGSTSSEERVRAFQLDMLQLDIDYALNWVETMAALVDQRLAHDPFTEQRIEALKEWDRKRKLAQVRLRSQYNPKRRRADLIDATTREGKQQILENLRQSKLDMEAAGIKRPEWRKSKGRKLDEELMRNAKAEIAAAQAQPLPEPTPQEYAQRFLIELARLASVSDALTASDSSIMEGLRRRMIEPAKASDLMSKLKDAVLVLTGKPRPLIADDDVE